VDVLWAEAVCELLQVEQVDEELVQAVYEELKGVIPMPYCSKQKERGEDGTAMVRDYVQCIPLVLARAATVHKFQGSSLDGSIVTLGEAKMYGCPLTAFTRSRGGLKDILLAWDWDVDTFLELFNAEVPPDFDMRLVDAKLDTMSGWTAWRKTQGVLFQGQFPPGLPPPEGGGGACCWAGSTGTRRAWACPW
jgi:hypothetical protein